MSESTRILNVGETVWSCDGDEGTVLVAQPRNESDKGMVLVSWKVELLDQREERWIRRENLITRFAPDPEDFIDPFCTESNERNEQ